MSMNLEARPEGKPPVRVGLPDGRRIVIGRGADADLKIEGDTYLSRRHAEAVLTEGRLAVKRLPGVANPIVHRGEEKDEFSIAPGDWFAIGKTRFALVAEEMIAKLDTDSAQAAEFRHTLSEADLYSMSSRSDRMRLLDLLELPEMLRTMSRPDFFVHLAGLLRMATGARWAAVAAEDGQILARDAADDGVREFRISRSLTHAAIKETPRPTIYVWSEAAGDMKATVQEGTDWAICVAMKLPGEQPVLLYVAGAGGGTGGGQVHQENARYVGLVADMVGRSFSVQRLEAWQGRMQQYFSGAIITKILESPDSRELEPKVAEATIMFFDIRGFSKRTEGQNEKILSYLGQLRGVMTAMTEEIFRENGVVLQYLGDGIMACWNVPLADPEHVNRACRAAMRMADRLSGTGLGWRCGIGLHTGEVVAGSLGSDQVFSYGVMGAVVNQTSRVEGITKTVETPILVTREVARKVTCDVAVMRRVGRFQPAGMTVALELFEPLPPNASEERMTVFAEGLGSFEKGEFEDAYKVLDRLPPEDMPARYIKSLAESYRRRPPRDFKGIIELSEK